MRCTAGMAVNAKCDRALSRVMVGTVSMCEHEALAMATELAGRILRRRIEAKENRVRESSSQ